MAFSVTQGQARPQLTISKRCDTFAYTLSVRDTPPLRELHCITYNNYGFAKTSQKSTQSFLTFYQRQITTGYDQK